MTDTTGPRRERILDAAIASFGAHGFAGATWRGIAERAGVNQALIKFYFTDKDGLWHAALVRAQRQREASLPVLGERVTRADVARWVAAYVRDCAAHPDYARMLMREATAPSPRLDRAANTVLRAAHRDFYEGVERLQERGWFAGMDPLALLYALVGAANYPFLVTAEIAAVAGEDTSASDWVDRYAETIGTLFARHGPDDPA